jgi:type IV secretory pathway VirB2 component (pilin)
MRFNKLTGIATIAAPALLVTGAAHAAGAGASPMTAVFTTVEGWLTGDIAEFLGVCAIVGLGALIWLAHEYGHMFIYVFRGILAVAVVVFAVTITDTHSRPTAKWIVNIVVTTPRTARSWTSR